MVGHGDARDSLQVHRAQPQCLQEWQEELLVGGVALQGEGWGTSLAGKHRNGSTPSFWASSRSDPDRPQAKHLKPRALAEKLVGCVSLW